MEELVVPGPFGPYELLATLGSGGFGVVYRARRSGDGIRGSREIALKVFRSGGGSMANPAWQAQRLQTEIGAMGALQSPHVVGFRQAGYAESRVYIEMELVRGPALSALLDQSRRPLSPAAVVQLALHLAAGLEAAHEPEEGDPIVHRDLKPGNILVSRHGLAKIADFGLAKMTEGGTANMSLVVGTAGYTSPEQLLEGGVIDPRADLFPAGIILFEAAVGERLFPSDKIDALFIIRRGLRQHLAEKHVVARVDARVPGLGVLVEQLLAERPEDRFPSARAFGKALRSALDPALLLASDALREEVRSWQAVTGIEFGTSSLGSPDSPEKKGPATEVLVDRADTLEIPAAVPLRALAAGSEAGLPADEVSNPPGGTGAGSDQVRRDSDQADPGIMQQVGQTGVSVVKRAVKGVAFLGQLGFGVVTLLFLAFLASLAWKSFTQ